jgi:phage shock protein E
MTAMGRGNRTAVPAEIDVERLQTLLEAGVQLVEVLPAEEFAEAHLPGATSVPLKQLDRETTSALDKNDPVVVYCWDSR